MGMSEGKPGKTGAACGMWVAGFILALGAGLSTLAMVFN